MDKQAEMMKSGERENYPERYDKEAFIEELKKSESPDKMSWVMLSYIVQNMADEVMRRGERGESSRYSGAHYTDSRFRRDSGRYGYDGYDEDGTYYDGAHMYRAGVGMRRYTRYAGDERICEAKEQIGKKVGHELSDDEIKCLIVTEAASLIKKLAQCEDYGAVKEFTELEMAMKGLTDNIPEEVEYQAKVDAISTYARMFGESGDDVRNRAYRSYSSSPARRYDYEDRERFHSGEREGRRSELPRVEIGEFGRRGRSRDSMGRFN